MTPIRSRVVAADIWSQIIPRRARSFVDACRNTCAALAVAASVLCGLACHRPGATTGATEPGSTTAPRPAVFGAQEGERRFLRVGAAPLLVENDSVAFGL